MQIVHLIAHVAVEGCGDDRVIDRANPKLEVGLVVCVHADKTGVGHLSDIFGIKRRKIGGKLVELRNC